MADADEELTEQPAGIRSFWTGTITFGLVTVPVALGGPAGSLPLGPGLDVLGSDIGVSYRSGTIL